MAAGLADPVETLGVIPDKPLPWFGWGDIPDQYGRRWNGDDGETPLAPPPDGLTDLPPILPWWGTTAPASAGDRATFRRHRDQVP